MDWKKLIERGGITNARVEISKKGEVHVGILKSIICIGETAILKIAQCDINTCNIPFEYKPNNIGDGRIQVLLPYVGMLYIYLEK